jgi:hypothetical protein
MPRLLRWAYLAVLLLQCGHDVGAQPTDICGDQYPTQEDLSNCNTKVGLLVLLFWFAVGYSIFKCCRGTFKCCCKRNSGADQQHLLAAQSPFAPIQQQQQQQSMGTSFMARHSEMSAQFNTTASSGFDAEAPAAAPASKASDLTSALEGAQLSQFEDALRELGCTETSDLAEVQEEELVALGMKKIEVKRLMRLAQ